MSNFVFDVTAPSLSRAPEVVGPAAHERRLRRQQRPAVPAPQQYDVLHSAYTLFPTNDTSNYVFTYLFLWMISRLFNFPKNLDGLDVF